MYNESVDILSLLVDQSYYICSTSKSSCKTFFSENPKLLRFHLLQLACVWHHFWFSENEIRSENSVWWASKAVSREEKLLPLSNLAFLFHIPNKKITQQMFIQKSNFLFLALDRSNDLPIMLFIPKKCENK